MTRTQADRRRFIQGALALGATALGGSVAGAATKSGVRLWPGGVVDVFMPSVLTHSQSPVIQAAIREINDKTNVHLRMIYALPGTGAYVRFIDDGTGNFAKLGMPTGNASRDVHINKNVRSLHELGHVLGLIHEHQRSDRDQHIEFTADFENPERLTNGDVDYSLNASSDNQGLPYNVGSFMHYWDRAGSSANKRTIIYKADRNLRFGTPEWLNDGAVQAVNALYPVRAAGKPAVLKPDDFGSATLWNAHASVWLDAGPDHRRRWRSGEGESNPFLRWELYPRSNDTVVIYNRHRNGFLDAGPGHFRAYRREESVNNPYLRWKVIPRYNYYVLQNPHTGAYLDAGPNHARKSGASEELSNPYLRWVFDAPRA